MEMHQLGSEKATQTLQQDARFLQTLKAQSDNDQSAGQLGGQPEMNPQGVENG
jgi:hypothetical protein